MKYTLVIHYDLIHLYMCISNSTNKSTQNIFPLLYHHSIDKAGITKMLQHFIINNLQYRMTTYDLKDCEKWKCNEGNCKEHHHIDEKNWL